MQPRGPACGLEVLLSPSVAVRLIHRGDLGARP
jgi:hypothetical protein